MKSYNETFKKYNSILAQLGVEEKELRKDMEYCHSLIRLFNIEKHYNFEDINLMAAREFRRSYRDERGVFRIGTERSDFNERKSIVAAYRHHLFCRGELNQSPYPQTPDYERRGGKIIFY